MKKILALLLVWIMLCTLCGCGKSSSSDKSWAEVSEKKLLKIGITVTNDPFSYYNSEERLTGFDVVLAKEACFRLNLQCEFIEVAENNYREKLNSGEIDCYWSELFYEEGLNDTIEITQSYLFDSYYFTVPNNSSYYSIGDLEGAKVALVDKETVTDYVLQAGYFVSQLESITVKSTGREAIAAMEQGNADVVAASGLLVEYYNNLGKNLRILSSGNTADLLFGKELVVGFKKGSKTLCNKVQQALDTMNRDGSMRKLSMAWFGNDYTIAKK